jgi:hypothetical protein
MSLIVADNSDLKNLLDGWIEAEQPIQSQSKFAVGKLPTANCFVLTHSQYGGGFQ